MKVVHVTPDFPPPLLGGGGYHVYHLSKELVKKGLDITVFTFSIERNLVKKAKIEEFDAIKVYRVPASYVPKTTYPIAPKLIPLLITEKADLIHAHGYQFFTSDAALIASKVKKIPFILTLHGFPQNFSKLTHRIYFNFIGAHVLKNAKKIISVSTLVAKEFYAISVPQNKMVIIPNGVNLEEYIELPSGNVFRERLNISENEKVVLAVGRLEEIKGFQYLIRALPTILKEAGPTKLVIIGPEFNYGAALRQLANKLHVQEHVIFYGPANGKEKLEAFAAADVVAVSSLYEGFGMLLLEAMAAGKPLVATRTGAAPALIKDGENGLLVKPGDVSELADKLTMILNDKKLSSRLCSESKKIAETYSWVAISERIHKLYIECLSSPQNI